MSVFRLPRLGWSLFVLIFLLILGVCCACAPPVGTSDMLSTAVSEGVDNYYSQKDLLYFSSPSYFSYYRDPFTDVMYLVFHVGYKGGLTVMLDPATGLPLTYSDFVSLYGGVVRE